MTASRPVSPPLKGSAGGRWGYGFLFPPVRDSIVFPCVLALLLFAYFHAVLVGGQSLYARDLYNFHFPLWKASADVASAGGWPVWNPLTHFGQPAWGNPNYLISYPLSWVRFVMDPLRAVNLFIVVHLFLGGLAFRALCRRWGVGKAARFWGGLAYPFLGANLSATCVLNLVPYVFLAPALLAAVEDVLRRPGATPVCRAAILGGLTAAAFEPVMVFGLMCALAVRVAVFASRGRGGGRSLKAFARLACAGVLSVLAAAVCLSEGLRLLGQSERQAGMPEAAVYSQHPLAVVGLWVPNPFGMTFDMSSGGGGYPYSGGARPYLFSVFSGMACLALAAVGCVGARRREVSVLLGVSAGFLVLSLGVHLPFWHAVWRSVPVLGWGRYPEKLMLFAQWALLLCAMVSLGSIPARGAGPDGTGGSRSDVGWGGSWRTAGVAFLAMAVALCWACLLPGSSPAAAWWVSAASGALCALIFTGVAPAGRTHTSTLRPHLIGALLLLELVMGNRFAAPTAGREFFDAPSPVLSAIKAREPDLSAFRVHVEGHPPGVRILGKTDSDVWRSLFYKLAGYPFAGFEEGVYYGFNPVFDGMETRSGAALRRFASGLARGERLQFFARCGVKYLVTWEPLQHPGVVLVGSFPVNSDCIPLLYEIAGANPRVTFHAKVRALGGSQTLRSVFADLQPGEIAATAEVLGLLPSDASDSRCSIRAIDRSHAVEISVRSEKPGVLALRDTRYDGWRAEVDGREARIHPVDVFFQGVVLPAGEHVVVFSYRPRWGVWPTAISSSTTLVLAALSLRRVRRCPRKLGDRAARGA